MCCDSLPVMIEKSLEKRRKKCKSAISISSLFLIAGKIICNAVKFAYDFMAYKKIAVHYVRFQNCLLTQHYGVLSNLVYRCKEKLLNSRN